MTRHQLFEAIGLAKPEYLAESEDYRAEKPAWRRYAALAACAVLAVGLFGFWKFVTTGAGSAGPATPMEAPSADTSGAAEEGASGADGGTHNAMSSFLSYAGPVFPLTLREENSAVSAERELTIDFAPYTGYDESFTDESGQTYTYHVDDRSIELTDRYVLTNSSDTDIRVTALWPLAASLRGLSRYAPSLTIDGEPAGTQLYAGAYAGGFQSVYGPEADDGERWNPRLYQSWTEYEALLADGSYLNNTLSSAPELNQRVIVYRFENTQAPDLEAATLAALFTCDESKTTILNYNFNGVGHDDQTGETVYSYFTRKHLKQLDEDLRLLAVLGEDIGPIRIQGYQDGGCDAGEELDGFSVDIVREEMTLGELIALTVRDYVDNWGVLVYDNTEALPESERLLLRCTAELLTQYGLLSENPAERYQSGRLDQMIGEAATMNRVCYAAFDVTIPAGGSVTVELTARKAHSYNFVGAGAGNENVDGFEILTRLGSNLSFTRQTAAVETHGLVEIVRENLGLDAENGVMTAELDPNQEEYYLEVHPLTEE